MQLGIKHDTAETNPMNGIRRAVCGKTARTVRRGGDRFIPALYSTNIEAGRLNNKDTRRTQHNQIWGRYQDSQGNDRSCDRTSFVFLQRRQCDLHAFDITTGLSR